MTVGERNMGWGKMPPTHPLHTYTERESPHPQFLGLGSPSRLRASLLPQMPGCKEGLGLAPPWRLKIIVILTALWKPGKGRR